MAGLMRVQNPALDEQHYRLVTTVLQLKLWEGGLTGLNVGAEPHEPPCTWLFRCQGHV
jgi:hypothetical protein